MLIPKTREISVVHHLFKVGCNELHQDAMHQAAFTELTLEIDTQQIIKILKNIF